MKKAKRIAAAVIALFLLAGAASPATLSSAVYADGGNGSEYRTVSAACGGVSVELSAALPEGAYLRADAAAVPGIDGYELVCAIALRALDAEGGSTDTEGGASVRLSGGEMAAAAARGDELRLTDGAGRELRIVERTADGIAFTVSEPDVVAVWIGIKVEEPEETDDPALPEESEEQEPAVPEDPDEEIEPDETPLAVFTEELRPTGGSQTKAWALVNVLCTALAIYVLVPVAELKTKFGRGSVKGGRFIAGMAVEVIAAAACAVITARTLDLKTPMVLIDSMTPVMLALAAVVIGADMLCVRRAPGSDKKL